MLNISKMENSMKIEVSNGEVVDRFTILMIKGNRFSKISDEKLKPVQDALRYTIEKVSNYARFILTANDNKKLTPAIKSRCVGICFDVVSKDRPEVIDRLVSRYQVRLEELGITVDPKRLQEIAAIYFPDLRAVANQIDFEFGC